MWHAPRDHRLEHAGKRGVGAAVRMAQRGIHCGRRRLMTERNVTGLCALYPFGFTELFSNDQIFHVPQDPVQTKVRFYV